MSSHLALRRTHTPAPLAGWSRFVMLDLHSLLPFVKTIVITFAVMILLGVTTAPTLQIAQTIVALGVIMAVPLNLFAADEQAGLELLYQILPIRKRTRVVGRYATVLLTTLAAVVVGTGSTLIEAAVTNVPSGGLLVGVGTLIAAALIVQAVQLPLYFALGYQRARLLNFALLAVAALLIILAIKQISPAGVAEIPQAVVLGGSVLVAVTCYALSAWLSYSWYRRREF